MATGQTKFLGCAYSTPQAPNFAAYFNQVTPENAGKWGSVEVTRDVMNWTQLDEAYNFAKANGMEFRFHILVWGSQQPSWISALTTQEKREEIEEWYAAVAARYPDLDYVEVVNEPLHAPPNGGQIAFSNPAVYAANYSDALGGAGASGWEWLVQSFRLARQYFPGKKLVLNEYGLLNDAYTTGRYVQIINLLKAENLVDVIATQAHAFETYGVSTQTLTNNLATLAATGVPVMITEMDIDGATDQAQLTEYQRVFPILWNNPAVIGITLWGYRPGLWRNAQGAYLVLADNTERPAMQWLRTIVSNFPPVITSSQMFVVQASAVNGTALGTVQATDANAGTRLQGWAITGGTGASYFAIDSTTGQVTVSNRVGLDLVGVGSYTLQVTVGDGIAMGAAGTVTILTPASAPSVTTQPAAATVAVGGSTRFTFAVSSPVAATLKWQESADGGATWSDLVDGGGYSSVTGGTLQLSGVTAAMNHYRYRCVATNLVGVASSEAAILTVLSGTRTDFNGDGSADLVWQNTATGERAIWLMNKTSKGSEVSLGAVPVEWQVAGAADFNGDGKTDILWQNNATGQREVWLMNGTALGSNVSLGGLSPDWQMVGVGDFNGDGATDIVLQNTASGESGIRLMNGTAYGDWVSLGSIDPAWRIAGVGDFNNDQSPDLLLHNRETGGVSAWLMADTQFAASVWVGSAPVEWTVAGIADLNGDQKEDIVWANTETGAHGAWLMDGTSSVGWVDLGTLPLEWRLAGTASELQHRPKTPSDFDGDGRSDILFTNSSTGDRALWLMNGTTISTNAFVSTVPLEWVIGGTGDFDGDGKADLLWSNTVTGDRTVWLMNGGTVKAGGYLGSVAVEWVVSGTGDFDGDGKADLLWSNPVTGEHAIWLMNGITAGSGASLGMIPVAWVVSGVSDFNGDGKADILLSNSATGERALWLMNGTSIATNAFVSTVPVNWTVSGTGDLDGDGKADILWSNTTTGDRSAWLMNGSAVSAGGYLGAVPVAWAVNATGDYNGDGKADILWTNATTGEHAMWLMNGLSASNGASLGTVPVEWRPHH